MPKQSFEDFIENEKNRNYELLGYIKLTEAYKQFRQENFEKIKQQIEYSKSGNLTDPFMGYAGVFPPDHPEYQYDVEWQLLRIFCSIPEGKATTQKLKSQMRLHPYRAAKFREWSHDHRFFTLEVDLECSKDEIRAAFEHWLDFFQGIKAYNDQRALKSVWRSREAYKAHVDGTAPPPPDDPPPQRKRGYALLKPEETDEMIHAYKLVEKEDVKLHATWKLYPDTDGKQPAYDSETNRLHRQVMTWHKKVKGIIEGV